MKRMLKLGIPVFILCVIFFNIGYAVDTTLDYWYATEDTEGVYNFYRYTTTPVIYYTHYDNLFSSTVFAQANVHAANEWTDNVMQVNITTTSTDSNLKVYGGSRAKMRVYVSPRISDEAMGYTDPTSCVYNNVIYEYDGDNIYEYIAHLRKIAVIYSQSFANDPGYANYYKNIITHEIGHALGWHGHSSVTSDLMSASVTKNNITVGTRDAAHLNQIYDLYR